MTVELFRTARDYHGAVALYCRAMHAGSGVEDRAQEVIAASLHYRLAIEQLIGLAQPDSPQARIGRRRLLALHSGLHFASRQYNLRAKRRIP